MMGMITKTAINVMMPCDGLELNKAANKLLAEAERLEKGPQDDPTDNDSAKAQLAYVEGWLAACGGEVDAE